MRSLLSKITALAAVLFMVLGFLAVPSASAQTYPPVAPPPVNCDSLPAPSIAIVGTDVVVTFETGTLTCIIRIVIEINPVLYDGPPPFADTITRPIPALEGDEHTATVTAYYAIGIEKSASVKISASALAAARANFAASGLAGGLGSTTGTGTGVGVPVNPAVPVPGQNLAYTGSSVSLPLAAGALLVGGGGLVLLAARKREQKA